MSSERATMQDIADALNVSRSTVDRVLNGRGRCSASTADRIIEKARELGYSPNPIARRLALNRRFRIAIVCPTEPRHFYDSIRRGMESAERNLGGYDLEVVNSLHERHDPMAQRAAVSRALEGTIDALVLIPSHQTELDQVIGQAAEAGVTVVTVNTDAPFSERNFHVGHDFRQSGRVAGELMASFLDDRVAKNPLQTISVAQLSGIWKTSSRVQRLQGFQDSISKFARNIELTGPHVFEDTIADAAAVAAELLDGPSPPMGFFSASSSGQIGVAHELLKRGLGGRVRNIGVDVSPEVRKLMRRNVIHATIDQDPYSQGYYALSMLHRHLTEEPVPRGSLFHTRPEVVLRCSAEVGEHDTPAAHTILAPPELVEKR